MELAINIILVISCFYFGWQLMEFIRSGAKFFNKANKIMDIDNINIYVNKENE